MLEWIVPTVILAGFNNSSFERNIVATDVWVYTARDWQTVGDAGTWAPNNIAYSSRGYDQDNVGFVQTGWALPQGKLSSWIKLNDATSYRIGYLAATRLDNPLLFDSYNFNIYNHDNTLVYSSTLNIETRGTWAPQYHIFTTSGLSRELYRDYRVEFLVNNVGQLNIDAISLNEVLPTPGGLVLATASLIGVRRKRNAVHCF